MNTKARVAESGMCCGCGPCAGVCRRGQGYIARATANEERGFYENLQEIPGSSFVYARTHNTEFLRGILRLGS